jgi:hypothetical protein
MKKSIKALSIVCLASVLSNVSAESHKGMSAGGHEKNKYSSEVGHKKGCSSDKEEPGVFESVFGMSNTEEEKPEGQEDASVESPVIGLANQTEEEIRRDDEAYSADSAESSVIGLSDQTEDVEVSQDDESDSE